MHGYVAGRRRADLEHCHASSLFLIFASALQSGYIGSEHRSVVISGGKQDCGHSTAALARNRRGADETATEATSSEDDEQDDAAARRTKTFRDANASLTVWYPSELLQRTSETVPDVHSVKCFVTL